MRHVCAAMFVLTMASAAGAGNIVFDNNAGGAGGIDNAFRSDISGPIINADDVTLSTSTTITGIEWTGAYVFDNSPKATDKFTIEIYAADTIAGGPLGPTPLASFKVGDAVNRADSGFDIPGGFDVYEYKTAINFTMDAGTTYWVSVFNNTPDDANDEWFWGGLENQGNSYFSNDAGETWRDLRNDRMDFRLISIPAPAALSMMGIAFIVRRPRRRR